MILVGNKVDLRSSQHDESELESHLTPIFQQFKQVEMGIGPGGGGAHGLIMVVVLDGLRRRAVLCLWI